MRVLYITILGLLMMATPSLAQNSSQPQITHNFGVVTCRQHIPCPDSGRSMSASELAASATSCVVGYFSLNPGAGFFDPSEGLDTNNCLTNLAAKGMVAPRCCVVKLSDQSCTFHCVLSR